MPDLPAMLAATDASSEAAAALAGSTGAALCAHAPRLRRLVHRLLGWPAGGTDVDDVVQEVLLAAWRHRDSFRGEATLSTWLVRIAVRKAQNHARAAAVRRRLFGWWSDADAVARTPADADHDRLAATQLAMHRLAHRDREVLVLRYLEQREIPQIAELLGCSRTAVDARLSRARHRLRAELRLEPGA
ncbi:MAG TPA: sigma-70 family RNA polymerase sigma factor [Planctomycetota bacterium]|nr:sigma-70 family RNA polymerase sigma factor [Planctomycetota bacterium]